MLVVVLKAWVTETKETPCLSNRSTNFAKSVSPAPSARFAQLAGPPQSLGTTPPGAAPYPRPGPLAGIRVLDFSWALVGSITTKILGDLGCYIDGDLSSVEHERFRNAVRVEPPPLTREERGAWLATLDDVVLASDGYIPFRDNIDQAARHGVRFIADPGGSARSDEVGIAARENGIVLVSTGIRLFHH